MILLVEAKREIPWTKPEDIEIDEVPTKQLGGWHAGDIFIAGFADGSVFVPSTLVAQSTQWLDGIAQAAGAGGTFFRSTLSLTNPGGATATATLAFTGRNETTPSATESVELAGGQSIRYGDVRDSDRSP